MISIRIFLVCTLYLVAVTRGQRSGKEDCETNDPSVFYRMLVIKGQFVVGSWLNQTKADALKSLRKCYDSNIIAEEMAKYIESFGLNATGFRHDPFSKYDGDDYQVHMRLNNDYRIVMATLFDYSKFLNTRIYGVGWHLEVKTDIQKDNETIPAGSVLKFDLLRFRMHGRDFCLKEYFPYALLRVQPGQRHQPIEYNVESSEWGSGVSRGLATFIKGDSAHWDVGLVMTFPGDV